jgi:hypothetical protein
MPSGKNPWNQILSAKRRRAKGTLSDLTKHVWRCILVADAGLDHAMESEDSEDVRRWLHVTQQLSGTYLKILVDHDIETRLRAIEEKVSNDKPQFSTNGQAREVLW